MLFRNRLTTSLLSIIIAVVTLQACGTSGAAVNPKQPQVYLDSYENVIKGAKKGLKMAGLRVYKSERINNNTYYVQFFQKKYNMHNNGTHTKPDHMASMTIKKISEKKTRVDITEQEQLGMIPNSHKKKLGRDLLQQMNKLLHNEKAAG